jgi:hypothetical protein
VVIVTMTSQPKIAHGIARLHPEAKFAASRYEWGPEWTLPPARTGRWVIDKIYNTAIRVEFDPSRPAPSGDIYIDFTTTEGVVNDARDALSDEEKSRRDAWLTSADTREADAFAKQWTVRRRREHNDVPQLAAGTYVRERTYSGVWHIATGQTTDHWNDPSRVYIRTECGSVDFSLADPARSNPPTTTEPESVCKRCLPRRRSVSSSGTDSILTM